MPWTAQAARRAGTVHLGPGYGDIAASLRSAGNGSPPGPAPGPPFLIVAQPSVADPSRAPAGRHVLWVYSHVPNRWPGDATAAIERQLDRFAPGFRDLVLARRVTGPADIEERNPNYVGGDIGCGSFSGLQAVIEAGAAAGPLCHPESGDLPLLSGDAAGSRGARRLWLSRCAERSGACVRQENRSGPVVTAPPAGRDPVPS